MQSPISPSVLVDVLRSPPVYLVAFAALVKWVVAPAVTNYMRHELKTELTQLGQLPRYVERLEAVETAIERLTEMRDVVIRIEEQVTTMHDERRKVPDRRAST